MSTKVILNESWARCELRFEYLLLKRVKAGVYNELYREPLVLSFLENAKRPKEGLFPEVHSCPENNSKLCICSEDRRLGNINYWRALYSEKVRLRKARGIRKILICGSRSFNDRLVMREVLSDEIACRSLLVCGGALGADKVAESIWVQAGLERIVIKPNWQENGKGAGMIRNKEMFKEGVEKVYAFWDGFSRGTKHSIEVAESLGIEVEVFEYSL